MKILPQAFCQQIEHLIGKDEATLLCNAITHTASPVSIRLNPYKVRNEETIFEHTESVKWCNQWGKYLEKRPQFTYDPLLHAGCYYVQEASSMFVACAYNKILQDFTPHRMLDLCAAPGGKSTLWRSLLPNNALLVANEPIRQRAQILAENMTKWGHHNVVVSSAYPDEFSSLGSFFDVVAADVPCSGEGMFRKDDNSIEEWSIEAVDKCAQRQLNIIESIWPTLRKGGYLVYSTCTYNRQENEDNVQRICSELGAEIVPLDIDGDWGISSDTTHHSLPVYHFFPHKTKGEGLFLALLRKTSEAPIAKNKKNKKLQATSNKQFIKNADKLANWLKNSELFKLLPFNDSLITAVDKTFYNDITQVIKIVKVLTAGIALAEEKGNKLIPQHALALSNACNETAFQRVELTLSEALSFLRREALVLDSKVSRGYVIATYHDHPLGFLNNLGSRANNLYPQEWRIRN